MLRGDSRVSAAKELSQMKRSVDYQIAAHTRRTAFVHIAAALGALALLPGSLGACSDSADDGASAAAGDDATSSGSGGAGPGSGEGGTGSGDVLSTSSGHGGGGGVDVGAGGACASQSFDAELVPLDIYIAFDQSYSMNKPAGEAGTRWDAVTTALKGFVQQAPADTSVGLSYFPMFQSAVASCSVDADCPGGCIGCCLVGEGGGHCLPEPAYDCNASSYATPDVPIAPLPDNESALVASLDAHYPFGGTPTSAALQGAIDHAKSWAAAHPTHKTIVVLATDGYPKDCSPIDIPSIAAIAGAGAEGTSGVSTFVVGVGDGLDNLNAIAAAGGTGEAFLVTDQNATAEFAAALDTIRKSLACDFVVPSPAPGEEADFEKVNVQYTPGNGQADIVGQVASLAECAEDGGWYYDDPANPKIIQLCPATCTLAKADPSGKVDVLLGCKTIIQAPK
jgi:hypothetical protein